MRYYRMDHDMDDEAGDGFDLPRREWSEKHGDHVAYLKGEKLDLSRPVLLKLEDPPGEPRDTYFPMSIPIVTPAIGKLVAKFASPEEVQRISALVEDGRRMEVLNILARVDCIDFERSGGIVYLDERERQREEAWSAIKPLPPYIKHIYHLVIDPSKAEGRHLFRIKGYILPVIVSEDLKLELQLRGASGVAFSEVSAGSNR
jgi:hypothetical protein